jgi:hypothetical protein
LPIEENTMRGLRDRGLTWRAFATDPCADLLRGQKTEYVTDSGNGNINITLIRGALVALGEVYRFVYAAGMRQDLPEVACNQIVKADVQSRVSLSWFRDGCFPGEPNFVPAPDGVAEDDGVALCLVLDTTTHSSFLLVLNAKDLREIARVQLDTSIPDGLHAHYLGEHYATLSQSAA